MTSPRVLLADPDAVLLASYRKVLSAEGFDVDVATSGPECLLKLRAFSPDVLVLEPELSGGGDVVLDAMRQSAEVPCIPVLVLADGHDLEQLFRVAAYPIDEWRDKPMSPDRLAASLRRLLSRQAASRPHRQSAALV